MLFGCEFLSKQTLLVNKCNNQITVLLNYTICFLQCLCRIIDETNRSDKKLRNQNYCQHMVNSQQTHSQLLNFFVVPIVTYSRKDQFQILYLISQQKFRCLFLFLPLFLSVGITRFKASNSH